MGAPCFCAALDCGNGYRCVELAPFLRDAPAAFLDSLVALPRVAEAAALDSSALPRVTEALETVGDGAESSLPFTFENKVCSFKGRFPLCTYAAKCPSKPAHVLCSCCAGSRRR